MNKYNVKAATSLFGKLVREQELKTGRELTREELGALVLESNERCKIIKGR